MLRYIPAILFAALTGVVAATIIPQPEKPQPKPSPFIHSSLKAGNKSFTLWGFRTDKPACPAYFMVALDTDKLLMHRHLQSCSGMVTMKSDGKLLTLTVPSGDPTNQTFFYTYTLRLKDGTWLDLDPAYKASILFFTL